MVQAGSEPGWLSRLFALVIGATLLVLGFMFSVVVLAVVAVLGAIGLGYFWWKTRALRKVLREQQAVHASQSETFSDDAVVIEGEARVVEGVLLLDGKPEQDVPIQR